MTLKEKIRTDLIESLKKRKETKVSVLKMIISSINNEEIKLKKKEKGLSDKEVLTAIKSEAKKRNDAIEAYTKANRPELAESEKKELAIIQEYLPEEMPDEEIEKIVSRVVAEMEADSRQDFGKVMKEVMPKIQGQADGSRVSAFVKKLLG